MTLTPTLAHIRRFALALDQYFVHAYMPTCLPNIVVGTSSLSIIAQSSPSGLALPVIFRVDQVHPQVLGGSFGHRLILLQAYWAVPVQRRIGWLAS